jgi:nitrite reductase/ring-hydroxylating ferredoxin subunit
VDADGRAAPGQGRRRLAALSDLVTTGSRRLLVEDLASGTARGFDPSEADEDPLFVVRRGDTWYAYRDRCPHENTRLPWRRDAYLNCAGDRIVCYAHGAEFDIATGQCLLGPCLGQSLDPVKLEITERGEIHVNSDTSDGVER